MPRIKTILVTGSSGQLGLSLQQLSHLDSNYDFYFANRSDLDLASNSSIASFFNNKKFDLIINCAAYTAVDKAEIDLESARQVNFLAVKKLAEISRYQQSKFIHISTDYVFNGEQALPYQEADKASPQSVYGTTKLNGEQAVFAELPASAVVMRTSWLYSEYGNNFVKTMLKLGREREELKVVFDQIGTPTYASDLAETIMAIISSQSFQNNNFDSQLYHYSNEGVCSWYDFAKAIFDICAVECQLDPIGTDGYPTPAKRPQYSLLNKEKIKNDYGLTIPYWRDSLKRCLDKLKESNL